MTDELRQITKELYEEAAKKCSNCQHKCFIYVFTTYIDENSYEYFLYQLEHESLPESVHLAYQKLIGLMNSTSELANINIVFTNC